MIRTRRLVAALVALFVIPAAGSAQNPYAEQVLSMLDGFGDTVLGAGYMMEGATHGWMYAAAEGATVVRLAPGSYVVIGACDDDCGDIDLYATIIDAAEPLGLDEELDATPIVEFDLTEEADVMIGIAMPDCATPQCYVGYRWFRADAEGDMGEMGGMGEMGAGGGSWEDQVMRQFDFYDVEPEDLAFDARSALVEANGEERFSLNLNPGVYTGYAVCDNDCGDVDLVVYDAGGSIVSSDLLEDDFPIVELEVMKGAGTYYFEVRMVSCSTSTCGYGFRLFERSGR